MSESSTEELTGPASPPASARGRSVLIAVFPHSRALPLPVANEIVGRDWLAHMQVPDPKVSREHLRFDRAGGVTHVVDVGSTNGSWIGGERLPRDESVRLQDGAVLRIGRSVVVYREGFIGANEPAAPVGGLVAPFGLARLRAQLDHLKTRKLSNVLVQGETGTGKELIANEIARRLGRENRYVAINVAGLAPTVFESQLFGHVRGAFTGADRDAPGVFLSHKGGAVFLDEIGDLALDLQARLLRLLENREVLRVGASDPEKVDVIVIAATHRDLAAMVKADRFREDLLSRLSAARVELPPLRARREDVFAIAEHLVAKDGGKLDAATVEPEAVERLLLHEWPTNVRELATVMGEIAALSALPALERWAVDKVLGLPAVNSVAPTSAAIQRALQECDGNQSEAARKLGVARGIITRHLANARK